MTAEKKVSGIKLHIGVDTNGFPHAMWVTTANISDRNGAVTMIEFGRYLGQVVKVMCDGAYTGEDFAFEVKDTIGAEVEIVKRNELHTFKVIPKRWVVERCFAWLDNFRRLWKNCERKLYTTLQMVTFAFAAILLKRY
jgi:transposase